MAKDKIVEGKVVGKKPKSKMEITQYQPQTPETLIAQAIDKGVSIETMERLLAMRRELKAEKAKEMFDEALSGFQSECPVIKKNKRVMNKDKTTVRYVYAPLDDIVEQVKPYLEKYGFSYTIDIPHEDNWIKAVVTLTHKGGHSKDSSFKVPVDKDAYMNAQQQYASALTFTKRYAFCNALGIMTGDQDDDAQIAPPPHEPVTPSGLQILQESLKKCPSVEAAEEYKQKIFESKKYTDPQKEEIIKLINDRIAELKGEPTSADMPN